MTFALVLLRVVYVIDRRRRSVKLGRLSEVNLVLSSRERAVRTCRAAMELTYKAIRQACIPPTVVISAPGLLVGSGMDTRLRGFLHAEPLAGAAHWGAHVEVQRRRS